MPGAGNRTDLHVEIGIMLGQCPDREDQMHGIDPGNPTLVHPAVQDHGLVVNQ